MVRYSTGNFYRVLVTTDAEMNVVVSKDVRFDENESAPSATSDKGEVTVSDDPYRQSRR